MMQYLTHIFPITKLYGLLQLSTIIFCLNPHHEKLKSLLPVNILGNPLHPAKVVKILVYGSPLLSLFLDKFRVYVRAVLYN